MNRSCYIHDFLQIGRIPDNYISYDIKVEKNKKNEFFVMSVSF